MYLHSPPWAPHTYDFVVLTSLTHPRKILLVVLQIGKQEIRKDKDLSAPLRILCDKHVVKGVQFMGSWRLSPSQVWCTPQPELLPLQMKASQDWVQTVIHTSGSGLSQVAICMREQSQNYAVSAYMQVHFRCASHLHGHEELLWRTWRPGVSWSRFLFLPSLPLTFPRGQVRKCLATKEEFETKLQISISLSSEVWLSVVC
jgi:hypothetical protein